VIGLRGGSISESTIQNLLIRKKIPSDFHKLTGEFSTKYIGFQSEVKVNQGM